MGQGRISPRWGVFFVPTVAHVRVACAVYLSLG